MDQISFFDNNSDEKQSARNTFACCSRYRECSDNKKCVISEKNYAINCTYRKKLEQGIVFFGKNANDFDISVYNKIVNIYNNLSDAVRYELNCLLVYFKENQSITLLYNTEYMQELIKYGFISFVSSKNDKKDLLSKLTFKFLKTFISEDKMNKLKDDVKNKRGDKARVTRDDLMQYLVSNDNTRVNEYIKKFLYAYIPHDMVKYMHELYHDFLTENHNDFKIKLPRDNETNFVKGSLK